MSFAQGTGIALRLVAGSLLLAFCSTAVAETGADELPELPVDLDAGSMPQVLTPARLAQPQIDVGASVTVLDRDMISALGARDVPELLRLVPGMSVMRASGSEFSVNYHGTNLRDIRRLQVLVDGMSVYQPALARILWSDLALSIDDIDRIEVTRGPNAAAYGANAFSGVVNIVTRHPQDTTGNMLRASGGNRDTVDGGGRLVGHGERSDWRLSFSARSDSGYDVDKTGAEYRDDRQSRVFNWRSEYRPNGRDRLEFMAGAKNGTNEEVARDEDIFTRFEEKPLTNVRTVHLLTRWSREISAEHALQVQAYWQDSDIRPSWRACTDPILLSDELAELAAIDPDFAFGLLDVAGNDPGNIPTYIGSLPTPEAQQAATDTVNTYLAFQGAGFTEVCGDIDPWVRESRIDVEVQDTLQVNDRLRVVSGGAFRRDRGSSETYLGDAFHNDVWRLFGHGELRLAEPLLLNAGAMLESDKITGSTISPRAALNWRILPEQSLRLVGSRAVRTQDLYEQYADTGLTFRQLSPVWLPDGSTTRDFFLTQQSPGDLEPERITAWEAGWFAHLPDWRTDIDVRWFREKLGHLVSGATNPFEFEADNNSETHLTGIEWQAKYAPSQGNWFWLTYAYIDNDSLRNVERRFTSLHSGSVAGARRFAERWQGSAAWYVNRYLNWRSSDGWKHFERLDLRLVHDIPLGGSRSLALSANGQYRTDDMPEILEDNLYNDRLYGWFGLTLTF